MSDTFSNLFKCDEHICETRVTVDIHRDLRAFQLRAEIRLTRVDRNQIRPQREDPLDVGIEKRTDALQLTDLWRISIEAADGDHLRAGTDGEQHLGHRRNEGDDPARVWIGGRLGLTAACDRGDEENGDQNEESEKTEANEVHLCVPSVSFVTSHPSSVRLR